MEKADRVLKQDARGRVWTPAERREAVLDEFEKSGLPAAQFAAHVGVKYPTFATWVQKRRKLREGTRMSERAAPVIPRLEGWVEAMVESKIDVLEAPLVVHLPHGVRLEVTSAAQAKLAACLLRALHEGAAAC